MSQSSPKQALRSAALRLVSVPGVASVLKTPLELLARVLEKAGRFSILLRRAAVEAAASSGNSGRRNMRLTAARYYAGLEPVIASLPLQPKFSVLLPVYKVTPHFLREALTSVTQQVYPHWEICIVDDCSKEPQLTAIIADFELRFPGQIHSAANAKNEHISATSNRCLALATGDFVTLLDHDDRLYPNALAEMARAINLFPATDILYSDETLISERGAPAATPFFKPAWSRFLHLTMHYTTHLSVFRRTLMQAAGGFRTGFEGAQDYDLMLRMVERTRNPVVHVPFCLYQWREHAGSTANSLAAKPYAVNAGKRALQEALMRRGRAATVEFDETAKHYKIKFSPPAEAPLVSIVIPSKDAPILIRRALKSLTEKSTYSNYEVIVVDNGSTLPATLQIYKDMTERMGGRFRAVIEPRPFNFGAQVNRGVELSRGEYILLLNNDTEVIEPAWIEDMLGIAQFPEVGAVGAKLLFEDGTIQHGGVIVSVEKIAEHAGIFQPEGDPRYWDMYNTMHEVTAVTAACLMVSKVKYEQAGGLDDRYLPCGFGDVDFCLKLRRAGLINVYAPSARLYHFESASRGQSVEYFEKNYMLDHWGKELAHDPYLNPNLLRSARYEINADCMHLDLGAADFEFFLKTPKGRWIQEAK